MNLLNISEAAAYLGKSVHTLQRWDRMGRLKPEARTPGNRRMYTKAQLDALVGRSQPMARRVVAYCRVSSQAQRPDLVNQRAALQDFCAGRGLANVDFVEEIGGGLNFRRKRFTEIMDAVSRGEISTLVIAHKDRLCRFGFEWFQHVCEASGCDLLVLNQDKLSPEQEMVQDLMTIVHCFSSRLYGLRNYRKDIQKALEPQK